MCLYMRLIKRFQDMLKVKMMLLLCIVNMVVEVKRLVVSCKRWGMSMCIIWMVELKLYKVEKIKKGAKYINMKFAYWRAGCCGRLWWGAPNCALYFMLIYFAPFLIFSFYFKLVSFSPLYVSTK